ncbi:hypothetical protein BDV38DRAFT_252365 [Aspergillus pseudotamarii]|uniref:Uncharacterized protein n=1 Tax=Aspergillus pseudotamarii TaxID=132259 RepID=A0A5N6SNI0_ASPPS|nr:uncharacterized protein BDV38DRAFT_252365 [Aspergillus pseudotamarii]KAE8135467.1 hypothetical protein BDV38DRAFT_252365 [Aspergillus pseudotamarii]
MDMKREFNNVNKQFIYMENRLDVVDTKVNQLGVRIEGLETNEEQLKVKIDRVEVWALLREFSGAPKPPFSISGSSHYRCMTQMGHQFLSPSPVFPLQQ